MTQLAVSPLELLADSKQTSFSTEELAASVEQKTEIPNAETAILSVLPDLARVVAHYFKTEESREDMMQDLVAHLLLKFKQFNGSSPFLHWALRITSNLCISKLRFYRIRKFFSIETHVKAEPECSGMTPHDEVEKEELILLTRQAIDKLKSKDREIILLCDIMEKKDNEVASILSITHANLRVKKHRARSKLKDILVKSGYNHE
ncbi:MAG: sigma-70 family RNA polymerase sigma factor [Planctomycetes bacterium]|nr:sigma-70 family RNA polymerase sigma factor [Planctomycetota bacterium]